MPSPGGPSDGREGRPFGGQAKEWLLLDGNRSLVAGGTVLLLFTFVALISVSPVSPFRNFQPIFYVFGALISGNLTLITVVVSINQLLLSRELKSPNELRDQMDGVIEYRETVEDAAGRVAPVEPLGFLGLLIENTRQEAQRLGGLSATEAEPDVEEELEEVVTEITSQADAVARLLDESSVSTFRVLSATLTTNYAREINRLRRTKSQSGEQLPDHVADSIDGLIDHLQNVDIARQYFKSIYLQQELASLSRLLFYAGLPSVTVVTSALFLFTVPESGALPPSALSVLVPAVIAVGLLPLCVLFAFILRTATVTRRTAATLPFTAPEQEQNRSW